MLRLIFSVAKTKDRARNLKVWFSSLSLICLIAFISCLVAFLYARPPDAAWIGEGTYFYGAILPLSGLLVGAFLLSYISYLFRQRERDLEAQSIHDDLMLGKTGDLDFVLYLRPFTSTNDVIVTDSISGSTYELESQLQAAVEPFSKLIGLGQSMEKVGIGRIEVTDDMWQTSALSLMDSAHLILMIPSTDPGTLWELKTIFEKNWLQKTIFINERAGWGRVLTMSSPFHQSDDWAELKTLFASNGYSLPDFNCNGSMFYFGSRKPLPTTVYELDIDEGILRDQIERIYRLRVDRPDL